MDTIDRERLVRVEESVKYIKLKVDTLCSVNDDVRSLKQTQKNIRRGVWATFLALITTGITYIVKGV
jgi:hypothetical protein